MKEIALYTLDIAQNSITAQAKRLDITLTEEGETITPVSYTHLLLRLLVGDVGEVAGHGVVGLAGGPDEVQGRHGELGGGAALELSLIHI